MQTRPVAHSVPEIEGQLGKLWARAAIARAEAAKAEAALVAAQAEAAARAAAALAAARETTDAAAHHVAARTSVLNLVVLAGDSRTAERCAATITSTASRHASRSIILSAEDPGGTPGLEARIEAQSLTTADGRAQTGAETIYVSARGDTGNHLASIIVPLLVHDLPVAMWWPNDPPFGTHRADRLLPIADRLIVDGSAWSGDGLDFLNKLAVVAEERRLVVVDWAMLRQYRWREALASVYDLPDLRPHLGAVRRIDVDYSALEPQDPVWRTNVVRPLYHVAWLASRLGMTVVSPVSRVEGGQRIATLRQKDHAVEVVLRPVSSDLGPGSTVRVEIKSRLRGAELIGRVAADDRIVNVSVFDDGRERVRRSYGAPRLSEVDLLARAVEEGSSDPVAAGALAMAHRLLNNGPAGLPMTRGNHRGRPRGVGERSAAQ
ncbi:MAG: glucose-6-phosphate dehydrogenase assembly protein OpcA [Candidatus Limnocylindrales bacterium]